MLSTVVLLIGPLIAGYFLGSIPFGLIITKLAGAGDVREIGSGNIGATNVLRTGRKDLAAATLIADTLKGFAAAFIFLQFDLIMGVMAGLGAFLGHLFPLWLRFKGGKGIATYIGILLAFSLSGTLVFAAFWLMIAHLKRYSSLAALVGTLIVPIFLAFIAPAEVTVLFFVMSLLAWWKHRENIRRLADGTEGKIGAKE